MPVQQEEYLHRKGNALGVAFLILGLLGLAANVIRVRKVDKPGDNGLPVTVFKSDPDVTIQIPRHADGFDGSVDPVNQYPEEGFARFRDYSCQF